MSNHKINGDGPPAEFDLSAAAIALASSSTNIRIARLRLIDDALARNGESSIMSSGLTALHLTTRTQISTNPPPKTLSSFSSGPFPTTPTENRDLPSKHALPPS